MVPRKIDPIRIRVNSSELLTRENFQDYDIVDVSKGNVTNGWKTSFEILMIVDKNPIHQATVIFEEFSFVIEYSS